TDVSVSGNTADAGPATVAQFGAANGTGGGLFINSGVATVQGSVFANDTANSASAIATDSQLGVIDIQGAGGGIFNQGRLTVTDTAFFRAVGNSGSGSAHSRTDVAGYGGGIDNFYGQVTATGVALFGNVANAGSATTTAGHASLAVGYGGGIYAGNV